MFYQSSNVIPILSPGTTIWVQNPETKKWDAKAKVTSRIRNRTYQIQMEDGKITYRNRRKIMVRYEIPNGPSNSMADNAMDTEMEESESPALRRSKRIRKIPNK